MAQVKEGYAALLSEKDTTEQKQQEQATGRWQAMVRRMSAILQAHRIVLGRNGIVIWGHC